MCIPFQLAYVMSDAGYDVWMPNTRGNCYSRHNFRMNPNIPFGAYWNFSWDDVAFQDFPVIFQYIRRITNQKKLFFIGHSEGTSSIMALLSEYPKWNKYLHAISLMAPVGFISNPKFFFQISRLLSLLNHRVTYILIK